MDYPHHNELVQEFWVYHRRTSASSWHLSAATRACRLLTKTWLGGIFYSSPSSISTCATLTRQVLLYSPILFRLFSPIGALFPALPKSLRNPKAFDKVPSKDPAQSPRSRGRSPRDLLLRVCFSSRAVLLWSSRPTQTFRYRTAEFKKEQDEAASLIKANLLTNDFVAQAVNVIITKLLIFRESDLRAWDEAAEEWESQERTQGDAWEWQVRPCAERIFMDLLIHFTDLLGPPLLQYFQTAMSPDADIISKEAVYTAMGCAVQSIYKAFDFDAFLASTLVKDAQIQAPLAKVLRRRIAILVSLWMPVNIADQSQPLVFEIFRHLMTSDDPINDEVVRITAARQLKWIVDDILFKPELFQPYAANILSQLIGLLGEVDSDETKLTILETVRAVVNRMDTLVAQFGKDLITVLPTLWGSSGQDAFMIKQAIITIISTLFTSMRGESQQYHAYVLPLIAEALDPATNVHKFLLEDAVDLWRALLAQCSPPISHELINLEDRALAHLDYGSKISEDCLEIVKAYVLLAPDMALLDQFRRPTLIGLGKILDSKSRETVHSGTKTMHYMLRAAQEVGGPNGLSIMVQDMVNAGVLPHILRRLHGRLGSSSIDGPQGEEKQPKHCHGDVFLLHPRSHLARLTGRLHKVAPIARRPGICVGLGEHGMVFVLRQHGRYRAAEAVVSRSYAPSGDAAAHAQPRAGQAARLLSLCGRRWSAEPRTTTPTPPTCSCGRSRRTQSTTRPRTRSRMYSRLRTRCIASTPSPL